MKYFIEGTASNMYAHYPFKVTVFAENKEQAESRAKRKARKNWAMGLTIEIKNVKED